MKQISDSEYLEYQRIKDRSIQIKNQKYEYGKTFAYFIGQLYGYMIGILMGFGSFFITLALGANILQCVGLSISLGVFGGVIGGWISDGYLNYIDKKNGKE